MKEVRWLKLIALAVVLGALAFVITLGVAQGQEPTCDREPHGHAIVINLDNVKSRETIDHAHDAVVSGKARFLHWEPALAEAHRRAALRGISKVPGKDLDEYPPAASLEGGAGADVRPIDPSDNRSAGAKMGAQLRSYCDGQAFVLEAGTP